MTRRILAPWFTGCLLALTAASAARAQMQDAFVDASGGDMQMFSPVDFDFEGMPINESSGWFFGYSKLGWAATGERTTVGQEGLTDVAEQIFRQNPLDDAPDQIPGGAVPTPYTIINGIQDGGPDANIAWGDRYELGYSKGGNGWLLGVLDGPMVSTNKAYGFNALAIPNTLPISGQFPGPSFGNPDFATTFYQNGLGDVSNGNFNPATLNGSGDITVTENGFGSVHVNFDTPNGYLFGWRDYHVNVDPDNANVPSPTTGGPGYNVVNVVRNAAGVVTAITISRGADGLADNLDDDIIGGFGVILADIDGDGTIDDDEIVATFVDYDDLHRFNVRFDRLYTRSTTDVGGFELMRTNDLDNSYMPVREQRNHFSIGYGARFLRLNDNFSWEGQGDVFGRSYAITGAENQIVGPQIRANWSHQRGRVGFNLNGSFLAGYNIQDLAQNGGIGENLNPGGLNSPLFAQPTFFNYGRQENFFSPVAEMRAEASYQLTSAFALKLGYTAIFADNITRASQIVNYRLPDMGFREGQFGKQNILVNGANFGLEAVY